MRELHAKIDSYKIYLDLFFLHIYRQRERAVLLLAKELIVNRNTEIKQAYLGKLNKVKDKQWLVQSTIQGIWVHSRFGMKFVICAFVLLASLLGQIYGHGMTLLLMCRSTIEYQTNFYTFDRRDVLPHAMVEQSRRWPHPESISGFRL